MLHIYMVTAWASEVGKHGPPVRRTVLIFVPRRVSNLIPRRRSQTQIIWGNIDTVCLNRKGHVSDIDGLGGPESGRCVQIGAT
jgi:hypothetical protein